MQDTKKQLEKFQRFANKLILFGTKYRFILLFIILGTAVGFALVRTRSYLDIPRNETRFSEETLQINYKQIDLEALATFDAAEQDRQIEVGSKFNPDRNNPFID